MEHRAGRLVGASEDENFGFLVPLNVNNVDSKILDPKNSWEDPSSYDTQAKKLVSMFIDNFTQFENDVDENIKSSGPYLKLYNLFSSYGSFGNR